MEAMWLLAAIGLFVALAILLVFASVQSLRTERVRQARRDQVLLYAKARTTGRTESRSDSSGLERAELRVADLLRRLNVYQRMALALDNGGLAMTPQRWVELTGLGIIGIWIVLSTMLGSWVFAFFVALLLGVGGSRFFIHHREQKRRQQFEDDLPEFFLLMSSGLRAGLSFPSALESVAQEGTGEVERQMRRAVLEISLGVPPDQALSNVADRMASEDLRWAVIAFAIQREVGGNLATILESVGETVRHRATLARDVRAATAEGRSSAYIMGAMPIVIIALFALSGSDFLSVFWTTGLGMVMFAVAATLIVLGILWLKALVKVKI